MAGIRTCDRESQVQRPNHYTTEPPSIVPLPAFILPYMNTAIYLHVKNCHRNDGLRVEWAVKLCHILDHAITH